MRGTPRELEATVRTLGLKVAEIYAIAARIPEPYRTAFELGHASTSGTGVSEGSSEISQSDPTGKALESAHREHLRFVCGQVVNSLANTVRELEELRKEVSAAENRLTGKKGVLAAAVGWDFVEAAQIEKSMKGATF